MNKFKNRIKVASIIFGRPRKRGYILSSVYISSKDENNKESEKNDNIKTNQFNKEYPYLLSYSLIGDEISLYFDSEEINVIFDKKEIIEFTFHHPFIIKIHIHDLCILDGSELNTFYTLVLIVNKIIRDSNKNNYGLIIEEMDIDNNFNFQKSNDKFCSYNITFKNNY